MKIIFIQTGGTIDKDYPCGESDHGWAFEISDPAVASIIPKSNGTFDYEIISLLKKDSLEITDEDRQMLYDKISALDCDKIVITHGTDTIIKSAEKLSGIPDKTIVITGAMLPEKFITSDAKFNVGMATASVQVLEPGVYVALYGRVAPWNEFSEIYEEFEKKRKAFKSHGMDKESGN